MEQDSRSEIERKIVSGTKWATFLKIIAQAFSWITTIIVVRYLTPNDYGLNSMLEVPVEILLLFSTIGLDLALIKSRNCSKEQLSSAFGLLLIVNSIFFLTLLTCAPAIAGYFGALELTPLIRATSVIFLLVPFRAIPNALLDRDLQFKTKSQVEFLATIIASLLSLTLAILGAGVWALVSALIANYVLRSAVLAYLKPWLISPKLDISTIKELLKYGGIITLGSAISVIGGKSMTAIAGPTIGAIDLGILAVSLHFAQLPLAKVMPIVQQLLYPIISKINDSKELIQEYSIKSIKITSLIIFPASIGLACISEDLIRIILGQQWLAAKTSLLILSALAPLRMLTYISHTTLNAMGHANHCFINQSIMCAMLAGGAFLFSENGISGLTLVWAIVIVTTTLISSFFLLNKTGTKTFSLLNALLPASISSGTMVISIYIFNLYLPEITPLFLTFKILLGSIVYITTMAMAFRKTSSNFYSMIVKR